MVDLKAMIRDIPDFPKPGILFKDMTPILSNPDALKYTIEQLAGWARDCDATVIAGIESRGFILGTPVALALGLPFVPIRKSGKLPAATHREEYALEYGIDVLEIHTDACGADDRVVIIDDLLATGGTASAACTLVEQCGAQVAAVLLMIELDFLKGAERLKGRYLRSLINY